MWVFPFSRWLLNKNQRASKDLELIYSCKFLELFHNSFQLSSSVISWIILQGTPAAMPPRREIFSDDIPGPNYRIMMHFWRISRCLINSSSDVLYSFPDNTFPFSANISTFSIYSDLQPGVPVESKFASAYLPSMHQFGK